MGDKVSKGSLIIASRIDELINKPLGNCLCGRGQYCEICDSYSQFNKLREGLRYLSAELKGTPIKPLEFADYSRSIKITLDDIKFP
jgi:hypothetical protein